MHLRLHFRRCQQCLQGFVPLSPGRQDLVLLAGHAVSPALHVKVTAWEGICFTTKSPCTFTVLTKSRRWGGVLFVFTPRKQQEQKAPCRMSQVTVRTRHSLWVLACTSWVQSNNCLDEKLDIFLLLTIAVSAEMSFLPGIVHAAWETSLKQIGRRLLLYCQYKPCLH